MSLEFWCPLRLEASAARRAVRAAGVARTGGGPRRAAAFSGRRAAADQAHTCAVVLGLGGAVSDALAPGDAVVADVVRGPVDDRPVGGPAAEAILSWLRAAGVEAVRGPVRSVARPVYGSRRHSLAAEGTLAVDMESWWLLAAEPRPLAVVRVVCDAPGAELVSLSLPWRVRRSLAVLSRIAATLEDREALLGQYSHIGPEYAAFGGTS
ncbi:MAG: hypothetical protein OXG47_02115 [bacterium]|nr:hypothetical protein [bacterium]